MGLSGNISRYGYGTNLTQKFYIKKKGWPPTESKTCRKCKYGLQKLTDNRVCKIQIQIKYGIINKQNGLISYTVDCYIPPAYSNYDSNL